MSELREEVPGDAGYGVERFAELPSNAGRSDEAVCEWFGTPCEYGDLLDCPYLATSRRCLMVKESKPSPVLGETVVRGYCFTCGKRENCKEKNCRPGYSAWELQESPAVLGETVMTMDEVEKVMNNYAQENSAAFIHVERSYPDVCYRVAQTQDSHTRKEVAKAFRDLIWEIEGEDESYWIKKKDFNALMKRLEANDAK